MDLRMQDARAFVAGASSGLGRAIARQLLMEGCRVAICSRTADRIESARDWLLRETGCPPHHVLALTCDVTQESSVLEALAAAAGHFGGLDLVVTNAGGPRTGQIDDLSAEDWRGGIELNLMSTINLCRAALSHLRAARRQERHASILMISSLSAKQPIMSLYLSNVARAGVQGFAKSLSEELGAEGITVNSILPGYTRTDRLSHLSESLNERTGRSIEDIEAGWAANSALKRIGTEDEFAAAATFLLSPRAGFITGQALVVDGGAVKSLL
ncbi:MAG: SDR family oxidoreductase [Bacteroidetes bacterium]|nr:SDR family oxidoreductase [Bacteroidota bacterium]MDA0874703.1 SDR family oxidoreductase [Bacteroidota bacterium]